MSSLLQELKSENCAFFEELQDDSLDVKLLQSLFNCLQGSNVSWQRQPSVRSGSSLISPEAICLIAEVERDKFQRHSVRIELVRELLNNRVEPPLVNCEVIISSETERFLPLLHITFLARQTSEGRTPKTKLFEDMFQMGIDEIEGRK